MTSAVDYLLHESSVGYAIFEVVSQPETIGNRLKEVQDAGQDLSKFGKMVKLVNFAPYRYTIGTTVEVEDQWANNDIQSCRRGP